MNIKQMLIEKERVAYIENNPTLAKFFDATLEYILGLEEQNNKYASQVETLETCITDLKTRVKEALE